MKTRFGFVSNSSSSSFIIMHTNEIKTVKDAEDLLPEYIESFRCKHGYGLNAELEIFTRSQVAEFIFRDIKKLTIEELKAYHLSNGRDADVRDYYAGKDIEEFTWKEFYSDTPYTSESYPKLTETDRENTARDFFHFYSVRYGDECDWGSFMEHQIAPMVSLKHYSHH